MIYEPHRWIMFRFEHDGKTIYKILAGWYGGFLNGDSWRINSSCVACVRDGNYLEFAGHSGSVYRVHVDTYGTSMVTAGILKRLEEEAEENGVPLEVLPEGTDWEAIEYE